MAKHSLGDGPLPPELVKSYEWADEDETVSHTM